MFPSFRRETLSMSSSYGMEESAFAKPKVVGAMSFICPQLLGAPVLRRMYEASCWKRSASSLCDMSFRYGAISFDVPTMAERASIIIIEHARNVSMVEDGRGNRLLGG